MPKNNSSYADKKRRGLVPFNYDRDSRSFQLGARRHWSGNHRTDELLARVDRDTLKRARENNKWHKFVS
jgi:hypothetical protein